MNRRTCPYCGGKSYSSYSGIKWNCPYCGKDIGYVPNESCDESDDYLKEKDSPADFYTIRGGKRKQMLVRIYNISSVGLYGGLGDEN